MARSDEVGAVDAPEASDLAPHDAIVWLPEAIGQIYCALYPGRVVDARAELSTGQVRVRELVRDQKHRFLRSLYWLRIAVGLGFQAYRRRSFFASPIAHERIQAWDARAAASAEFQSLRNAADWFGLRAPYSKSMAAELARSERALGLEAGVMGLSDEVGFRREELGQLLAVTQGQLSAWIPYFGGGSSEVLRAIEHEWERRLWLRPPSTHGGRPAGSFSPLQQRILDLLLLAEDPGMDWSKIRTQLLIRRGVREDGKFVCYEGESGSQRVQWASLRSDLDRIRDSARQRLAARKK